MQIGTYALEEGLKLIKNKNPLIYCISNLVTITELTKGILAYNGIPVISSCLEQLDEKDFTDKCILLNTDNLDTEKLDIMEKYLRITYKKRIPVVLDIMGINNSFFQKEIVLRFINRYNINVLKGNLQEFKTLFDEEYKEEIQSNEELYIKDEDKIKKDLGFRIKLRDFSRRNDIIVVLEKNYYYITDGFSEFYIDSKERDSDKVDIDRGILAGLIAVGIGASSSKEQRFKSVLLASMTMAISEGLVQNQHLNNRSKKELLIEEIRKIDVEKLNKLSKIDYLFVRK